MADKVNKVDKVDKVDKGNPKDPISTPPEPKKSAPVPATPSPVPAKLEMTARGVATEHHDDALAVSVQAESMGLAWTDFLDLLVEYGPTFLSIIKSIIGRRKTI